MVEWLAEALLYWSRALRSALPHRTQDLFVGVGENLPILITLAQIPGLYKSTNLPEVHGRVHRTGDDSCHPVISLLLLPGELFTFLRVEFGEK